MAAPLPRSRLLRPAWALAVIASALATPVTAQADERRAVAEFRRRFAEAPGGGTPAPEVQIAALTELQEFDSRDVARVLAQAHEIVDRRIRELEARRRAIRVELHELIVHRENERQRGTGRQNNVARRERRVESATIRREVDGLRPVRDAVEERVVRLRAEDAFRYLERQVVLASDHGLGLRMAATSAMAGAGHAGVERLQRLLGRARSTDDRAVVLHGLARAGEAARAAMPAIRDELDDDAGLVRELAGRALAATRDARAVAPLVDLLEASRGETRRRVAGLLEELTGERFGDSVVAWRTWWGDVSEAVLAGEVQLRAGRAPAADDAQADAGRTTTYMGIPQTGAGIAYVLDASLSMGKKVDFEVPGSTVAGGGAANRLQACKAELSRALGELAPEQRFGIAYFHETAGSWQRLPVPATPENVAAARRFVRGIEMEFATDIHDGFDEAFDLMADDPAGRPLGEGIDTIFLLTDGRPFILDPTTPGRRAVGDSYDRILAAIDDWDPFHRVTIHCIGIGSDVARAPMRRVARTRGGEARFY